MTAPFAAWFSAILIVGRFFEKSSSNAFVEAFLAGCAAWIPAAFGVVAARRGWPRRVAYFTGLIISCVIALCIFVLVPPLPE